MASASDALTQAIQAAEARYPRDEWYQLSPRMRAAAIYEELARLDAESVKATQQAKLERRKRPRRSDDRRSSRSVSSSD